jgi:plasmid stabilization system protein ParE
LGSVFLDDVQHALSNIRKYPRMGTDAGNNLRRAILTRFPYSVIYAVEPSSILIIAVAHHRRLPGYWKDRIG